MKRFFLGALLMTTATLATSNAQTIWQRRVYQQERISQGIGSGQLTAGETAGLENRELFINREIARDRAYNGGYLRPFQRAKIQAQLNCDSRAIWRDKHNGWVR